MSKLYELKLIKALVLMHFFRNLPTVFYAVTAVMCGQECCKVFKRRHFCLSAWLKEIKKCKRAIKKLKR